MGNMALYIKNLEIFFSLYLPSLNDIQKAILKDSIIELYNNFDIYWDTDVNKLSNEEFPVFNDLYNLIMSKSKAKAESENNSTSVVYKELALLLKDIAVGSDSFLWNGASTYRNKLTMYMFRYT